MENHWLKCLSSDYLMWFETHSRADWPEGHESLDVVGIAAAPGLPARVIAPLQDELLPAEAGVFIACPADQRDTYRKLHTTAICICILFYFEIFYL